MTAAWLGLAAQGTQSTHWFRDPKCHAHSHRGLASEGAPPRPHGLDECSQSPRRQHNLEEEAFGLNQNRDMSPSPQVPRKERDGTLVTKPLRQGSAAACHPRALAN